MIMRLLFLLVVLLLSFSPLCYGREIFEGGYSGSYAKDGYKPDTAVDVFTGKTKMNQRQKDQVYSAFASQDSNYEARLDTASSESVESVTPVYVAPINNIIKAQADNKSGDDSSGSADDNQNSQADKNMEESKEGK